MSQDKRDFAKGMRNNRTRAESKLSSTLLSLRRRGVIQVAFETQQLVAGFITDVLFAAKRLVIEADGAVHSEQSVEDAIRDVALVRRGYLTVRFTNDEILNNSSAVGANIADLLRIEGKYGPSLRELEERVEELRPRYARIRPATIDEQLKKRRSQIDADYKADATPTWSEGRALEQAQEAYDRTWWPWSRPAAQRRVAEAEAAIVKRRLSVREHFEAELRKLENPTLRQKLDAQFTKDLREFQEYEQQQRLYADELQTYNRIVEYVDTLESDLKRAIGGILPMRRRCRSTGELLKETRRACDELLRKSA